MFDQACSVIAMGRIEGQVLVRIARDFADPVFLARAVDEGRRMADAIDVDPKMLDVDIAKIRKQLSNRRDLAAETGDKAILTGSATQRREPQNYASKRLLGGNVQS